MLERLALATAGMEKWLDKVISVETVRTFKTTPTSYGLVGDAFGVAPHEAICPRPHVVGADLTAVFDALVRLVKHV
jgi:hypothetical protein